MYKLKKGRTLPKEFKVKVKPNESEALQKYYKELGYKCSSNGGSVEYLFVNGKSKLYFSLYGFEEKHFIQHPFKQINFLDYFEPIKWCIKVTKENAYMLGQYLTYNFDKYKFLSSFHVIAGYYLHSENVGFCAISPIYALRKEGFVEINDTQFAEMFGKYKSKSDLEIWRERVERISNNPMLKLKPFPKKWCILVTEDNYKELDVYLQMNKSNYKDFQDTWNVQNPTYDKNPYYFVSGAKEGGHSKFKIPSDHTLITTEQFRSKFGDLKPKDVEFTKAQGTEAGSVGFNGGKVEISENEAILKNRADYYKKRCNSLRMDKWSMKIAYKDLQKRLEDKESEIVKLREFKDHFNKLIQLL